MFSLFPQRVGCSVQALSRPSPPRLNRCAGARSLRAFTSQFFASGGKSSVQVDRVQTRFDYERKHVSDSEPVPCLTVCLGSSSVLQMKCIICHNRFRVKRANNRKRQVTCGKPACKRGLKTMLQRLRRWTRSERAALIRAGTEALPVVSRGRKDAANSRKRLPRASAGRKRATV
jgi:hypothetical protein